MTEWALNLKQQREYDSDETICHLITLRQLDDQVQDTLYIGSAVDLPLSDGRTLMHVRFLETQLEAWKRESQGAGAQRCECIHIKSKHGMLPALLTHDSTQPLILLYRYVAARCSSTKTTK
jgi:hypothetical protein